MHNQCFRHYAASVIDRLMTSNIGLTIQSFLELQDITKILNCSKTKFMLLYN